MIKSHRTAFTLIEILIVVVILGVLAAIVVPQASQAVENSATTATLRELQKLRAAVEVYRAGNSSSLPAVTEGNGTWGPIVSEDYLMSPPVNAWVGSPNGRVITFGAAPDVAYQSAYGWIYNPVNGDVFASSFDANDVPISP